MATIELVGGTGSGDILSFESTTHGTKGRVLSKDDFDVASGKVYKVNNTQVVGARGAALTDQLDTLTAPDPVTYTYITQDLVTITAWGFATQDEGHTVLQCVENLQTRVQELENRLKATGGHGLISDPT